ncbi:endonuclease/exonuclease/phosphatase family protein [Reichenbachiella agarivorans]|uniref:Endonuclease/exonuclease/phosphatase family protein n=1 Tax=Reichenbachiella agarivorans TaxID=2979464 RepID=A0ABY6CSI5_9BACT|nr:endonuclease/exonuclease/phosphatase family protein [Reichenbachiella agarivorans]UXP32338.1 endonuclease/exonuclease/phosphatase family protein [Reichenbachiella agarivorans]
MSRWSIRKIQVHTLLSLLSVASILAYASVLIPPQFFWLIPLMSYGIPVLIAINFILVIPLLFTKRKRVLYPLACLILGLPFILDTYRFSHQESTLAYDFSVLSYNVKLFREYKVYNKFSKELIETAVKDTSDFKCFQEFSYNNRWSALDVPQKMKEEGYYAYIYTPEMRDADHNPGMALFSKHKIIDKGMVWENPYSINGVMYIDVKMDQDTIRLYNVHLASMELQLGQYKQSDHYLTKIKDLFQRLKNGAINRSNQIEQLILHTQNCPYPYLIAGDFNDTPYSYNYHTLSRYYSNVFEKVGQGFGFSFNSTLFFLRIDHHFTNPEIEPVSFEVDRSIKTSDHFPTRGLYRINH